MIQKNHQNQIDTPLSTNTIALKRFFSSGIFLALGISLLAYSVFSFIYFIPSIGNFIVNVSEMFSEIIFSNKAPSLSDFLEIFSVNGGLKIFSIIMGITFITLYTKARKPEKDIKGLLNILKIISLISFIWSCIFLGIGSLIIIVDLITSNEYIGISANIMIFVFLIVIIALCIAISILPYKFYESIYISATTSKLTEKYSTILGILNILSLIFSGPTNILAIFTSTTPAGSDGLFATASYTVFLILETIFFFRYKSFVQSENA